MNETKKTIVTHIQGYINQINMILNEDGLKSEISTLLHQIEALSKVLASECTKPDQF